VSWEAGDDYPGQTPDYEPQRLKQIADYFSLH
jgi:hypothetical protein